jgi:hypothetical protein
MAGQLGKVSVGDLPVTEHPLRGYHPITDRVGPEDVQPVTREPSQDSQRICSRKSFSQSMPHERSLGDRAGTEAVSQSSKPGIGAPSVHMANEAQGYQDVAIEKCCHSSSSSCFTSSEVMILPVSTAGRPVSSFTPIFAAESRSPRPFRMSNAIASLIVQDWAWAIALAC